MLADRLDASRLKHSLPKLEQPALVAVRQWEYEPTIVAGKAVPVILRESVMFREFVNPTVASRERTTPGRRTPVTGLSTGSTGIPRDRATGIDLPWTYSDVTMAPGYDKAAEIERPITALAVALEREGLACMASFRNPTGGVIETTIYGSATYLVQCEGNCTGLIYGAAAFAPVQNRGADRGYPLLYLRSYYPARRSVYFKFVQSDPTLVADIKVHEFRAKGSATGSGCRF